MAFSKEEGFYDIRGWRGHAKTKAKRLIFLNLEFLEFLKCLKFLEFLKFLNAKEY